MDRARRTVLIITVIVLFSCCGASPPENPITCSDVPEKIEPVIMHYKAPNLIVGYRITTKSYILTSPYDAVVLGKAVSPFGGSGTIDEAKLIFLRSEMEEAKAKGARINFFGDEVGQLDGKIVVVLWRYKYKQYHQIYGQYKWGQDDAPPN